MEETTVASQVRSYASGRWTVGESLRENVPSSLAGLSKGFFDGLRKSNSQHGK
jgi:hypothetical protein